MHMDLVKRDKSVTLFRDVLKDFEMSCEDVSVWVITIPFQKKGYEE